MSESPASCFAMKATAPASRARLRASSLSIGSDSRLNLNDNDLIIDYAGGGGGGSPANDVFAKLVAGRAAAPSGISLARSPYG